MKRARNDNESRKLYLINKEEPSFMNELFTPEEMNRINEEPFFYYHHSYGYLMEDVENSPEFQANMKSLGFYYTEKGKKGLAIFQHKKYPFYGW